MESKIKIRPKDTRPKYGQLLNITRNIMDATVKDTPDLATVPTTVLSLLRFTLSGITQVHGSDDR